MYPEKPTPVLTVAQNIFTSDLVSSVGGESILR